MAGAQRNRRLSDNNDSCYIKGSFPHNVSAAAGLWGGVRIDGEDTWRVRWVETHSWGRFREHDIVITSRAGTHRPRETKHGGGPIEYVQKGNAPVLRYYPSQLEILFEAVHSNEQRKHCRVTA